MAGLQQKGVFSVFRGGEQGRATKGTGLLPAGPRVRISRCNTDPLGAEASAEVRPASSPRRTTRFRPLRLSRGPFRVRGVADLDGRPHLRWRVGLVAAYLGIGCLIGWYRGWTLVFSLYFAVETLTTVGYGEFTFAESSPIMQVSVACWVLLGALVMATAVGVIFDEVFQHEREAAEALFQRLQQPEPAAEPQRTPAQELLQQPTTTLDQAGAVYEAAKRRLRAKMLFSFLVCLAVILAGCTVVGSIEGWNWSTSFYWSCVTFTSVGYGDVVPQYWTSRVASIGLMAVGVLVVGSCAGFFGSYHAFIRDVRLRKHVLTQFGTRLTLEEFEALSHGEEIKELGLSSSDECITRAEFCLFMLVKLGRVDRAELRASQAAFDCLDATRCGILDPAAVRDSLSSPIPE